jgi:Tol biopolymer transport system component
LGLTIGSRLGVYEVTARVGEGGMGQVYRARDTKLNRDVALKVLPDVFATDLERLARFTREAQTLASLNHPNIAHIYGLEDSSGIRALVMELVEGEDLSRRIARGPIPLDEALPVAMQIAEALEAAHEQGIVHRDLKPANIKVRADGSVKVLDFGLAKMLDPIGIEGSAQRALPNPSMSPTITTPAMTQAGVILGTAAYMAPEQARGKAVDKRADIWAFGCVLFEMLTGRRAFEDEDISMTLSKVLQREPDFDALAPTVTPRVSQVIRLCLRKDPKQRVSDIRDVRLALDGAFDTGVPQPAGPAGTTRTSGWRRIAVIAAGALIVAIAAGSAVWIAVSRVGTPPSELRLDITTPPTNRNDLVEIAVSPDGRRVVFASTTEGRSQLWVRSLDAAAPQAIAGTDGAILPFWSSDSRSLGFFADSKLKRIDLAGGSVQTLAEATLNPRGGAWSRKGVILFAPSAVSPIYRVQASGGPATVLTQLEKPAQSDHRAPQFLPDGNHFLYYARGTAEGRGVYVGGLDGSHSQRLIDADAAAVYAATGHLLFVRQGTLYAVRFDPDRLALDGAPFSVAQQVIVNGGTSLAALSASEAGPIIYRAGGGASLQLAWIDRSGRNVEPIGDADSPLNGPALSPDGRQVVVARNTGSNWDLWLIDVARGLQTRLTSDPALDMYPVWSPDGSRVAFYSARKGANVFVKSLAASAREDALLGTPYGPSPRDWSSDGRFLLYQEQHPTTGSDLWVLPMSGGGKSFPVAQSTFNERDGQFSPDVKWIAYASDESGRSEVYVQPFPGPGDKIQVSTAGGAQVRWRADGNELFYVALDARLMAVPMQRPSTGLIVAGRPVPLFATHIGGALLPIPTQYVVARDGQRFLMNTQQEDTPPISVILNWSPKP